MVVKNIHIIQAQSLEALVETCQKVFARTPISVGSRPHSVARLGCDDQLVPVRSQVLSQCSAQCQFGGSRRWPVVVGEIEVGDPEVEGAERERTAVAVVAVGTEIVPVPQGQPRQSEPAASTAGVEVAVVVARRIRRMAHA